MKKYKKTFSIYELSHLLNIHPSCIINWLYLNPTKFQKYNYNQPILANEYIDFLNNNNLSLEKKDVLIIDDDEDFFNYISNTFKKNNLNTIWAKNGLQASYYIKKYNPKIITLDLKMKVLNGHELLDIVNHTNFDEKPWIVIISSDKLNEIESGILSGADFYLQKPITNKILSQIIYKLKNAF